MTPRQPRNLLPHAFSLVELLVVIGIITLLMAILLPGINQAREQGRRAKCLANLRSLGQAAVGYANDHPKELIIPIHQMMLRPMPTDDYWLHRTGIWFSFGGRSAPRPFLTTFGPRQLDDSGPWAARTRPLNRYIYGDISSADARDMELFECPSDRGYPDHQNIDDAPIENANRRCYDTLGNSYRASLHCFMPTPYEGAFSIGPWGHALSSIPQPSEVAAFGEPTFFNMIGMDNGVVDPPPVVATGWHQGWMIDNLVFCDGSARPTRATGHEAVPEEVSRAKMDTGANWYLISRGPGWRFDLWPTPGARVWSADPEDPRFNPPYSGLGEPDKWPFAGARDLLRP